MHQDSTGGASPIADDFSDLDNLLAEAMGQQQARDRAKELHKKIRKGSADEKDMRDYFEAELQASWLPKAECELWDQTVCECGHTHMSFSHYMVEYHSGKSKRWSKVEPNDPILQAKLHKRTILNIREVSHCSECSEPVSTDIIIWGATE